MKETVMCHFKDWSCSPWRSHSAIN